MERIAIFVGGDHFVDRRHQINRDRRRHVVDCDARRRSARTGIVVDDCGGDRVAVLWRRSRIVVYVDVRRRDRLEWRIGAVVSARQVGKRARAAIAPVDDSMADGAEREIVGSTLCTANEAEALAEWQMFRACTTTDRESLGVPVASSSE